MQNEIETYAYALNDAIDQRKSYEAAKCADSDNIQKTLSDIRKSVQHARIVELMYASNVNAAFINASERSTSRYNVYAAEKVVNVARTLAKVAVLNHYTKAILRCALALQENDMLLTNDDAHSACSLSVKSKDAKRESVLKAHKYAKHVAKSTATTQSSSSLNALKTFNLINETRDAANNVCYRVDTENEIVKTLLS
jgi:hypothetical protein